MQVTTRPTTEQTVEAVLRTLGAARVGKSAEANTEAGGRGTTSSHPSTDVDDGTRPATQGSRGDEFDKDRKEQQDIGIDDMAPVKSQSALQPQMGLTQSNPQDEAGISTRESRDVPQDGGTRYGKSEHPARVDNEDVAKKYATASPKTLQLLRAIQQAEHLGMELIPDIVKQAQAALQQTPAPAPAMPTAPTAPAAAGQKAAAPVAPPAAPPVADGEVTLEEKQAFDNAVLVTVAETVRAAEKNAIKLAQALRKMSEAPPTDENVPPSDDDDDDDQPSDEELLLAANGGGGDGGDASVDGPPAPQSGTGEDPLAAIIADANAGPDAASPDAAGGLPPDAGGPPPGPEGQMSDEEEMALAQEAMAQQGITPEMIQQSLAGKVANLVKTVCQKPATRTKAASAARKPKTAAQLRRIEEWKNIIRELVST